MFIIYGAIGIVLLLIVALGGFTIFCSLWDIPYCDNKKGVKIFFLISLIVLPLLACLFRTTIPTYELLEELNTVFMKESEQFASYSYAIQNFFFSLPYYISSVWMGIEQFCPKIQFIDSWWINFVIEFLLLVIYIYAKVKLFETKEKCVDGIKYENRGTSYFDNFVFYLFTFVFMPTTTVIISLLGIFIKLIQVSFFKK
ncbi:MAG: hypothetical protein IJW92_07800 [Clostridia bacterium]|nr:hypothetical protein [Clostridia bacterium]